MTPGMPGGTQFAMGDSCGGRDWNSLSMAAYLGVSEGICGGANPPRPNVISHTPLISGNFAIESNVPPGSLLASAANPGAANAIKARPNAPRACFVTQPV